MARKSRTTEPDATLFVAEAPPTSFTDLVETRFLDYAMSVIAGRALPDVRDGLKPVHRRILWAMHEAGVRADRPHVKCARIVGDVMGRYHPHGDAAIYEALVRMAQTFSLRVPLIDPHGNVGSPSDPPAAMRYLEARLAAAAAGMLRDIDEDAVEFVDNFDGQDREPVVLPSRFPNLLINGSQGIAVGLATNIPPHNPGEVIDAAVHLIEHPDATVDDLIAIVRGPDFPTGGLVMGEGWQDAYRTGRGRIRLRARVATESGTRGVTLLVATELPYQTSTDEIAERAAALVDTGTLTGIRDIRDESAGGKHRLVFELRPDADPEVVLANLFKHTPLQTTFGMNMVALDNGAPRAMRLDEMLRAWLEHQVDVITRRSRWRLAKAEARLHIVEGLLRALDMIDAIVALIRASRDRAAARTGLMADPFAFTEIQANHILDLPLARLTQLGRLELDEEATALRATIAELNRILSDRTAVLDVVRADLTDSRAQLDSPRRSTVTDDTGDIDTEALVADIPLTVTVTHRGYVKAVPAGARGAKIADPGDRDTIRQVVNTSTLGALLVFTDRGKVYKLRGTDIPKDRLTALPNLFQMASDERVVEVVEDKDDAPDGFVVTLTESGAIKRSGREEFAEVGARRDGAIAVKVADGDRVVSVLTVAESDELLVATRDGHGIRFRCADARPMGRNAAGVRSIQRTGDDIVVAATRITPDDAMVTVVTDVGHGKRVRLDEVPVQARGGKGVRILKVTARQGRLVAVTATTGTRSLTLVTEDGAGVAMPATKLPIKARDAAPGDLGVGGRVTAVFGSPPLD